MPSSLPIYFLLLPLVSALGVGLTESAQKLSLPAYVIYDLDNKVLCVYSLSGQYGLIVRYLYYLLLIFAIFARRSDWLVAGALISTMTYAGTAAVHAFILAVISSKSHLDLDAVGALVVCIAGALAAPCLLAWSTTLRESVIRPLVGIFGTLTSVGAICAAASVLRRYRSEEECWSSTDVLLTSKAQLGPLFDCTYKCFSSRQAMRDPTDIIALPLWQVGVGGRKWEVIYAAMIQSIGYPLYARLVSWCLASRLKKHTEAELNQTIALERAKTYRNQKEQKRGAFKVRRAQQELKAGKYQKTKLANFFMGILTAMWPFMIILIEIYLLAEGGLPSSEKPYGVGQWGVCVTVALAFIGAIIVHYHEPVWERRQKILAEDREAWRLRESGVTQPDATEKRGPMISSTLPSEPVQGLQATPHQPPAAPGAVIPQPTPNPPRPTNTPLDEYNDTNLPFRLFNRRADEEGEAAGIKRIVKGFRKFSRRLVSLDFDLQ